jgi:hypothetical protein
VFRCTSLPFKVLKLRLSPVLSRRWHGAKSRPYGEKLKTKLRADPVLGPVRDHRPHSYGAVIVRTGVMQAEVG